MVHLSKSTGLLDPPKTWCGEDTGETTDMHRRATCDPCRRAVRSAKRRERYNGHVHLRRAGNEFWCGMSAKVFRGSPVTEITNRATCPGCVRSVRSAYDRGRYWTQKLANRCTRCNGGRPEPGKTRCRYCAEDVRYHNQNYRDRKLEATK